MKIVSLQAGGGFPTVDYIPVIQNYAGKSGASKEASLFKNDSDELNKAIYKVIEEGGLTSDANHFYALAETLLSKSSMGLSPGHTTAQLIQLRKVANQLKQNKELYDDAVKHVRAENTGDDFALTTDGKVYVGKQTEEGKFELDTVKVSELTDKLDEWVPLTNKQLLSIRERSNEYAFRKDILLDVGGSIGMDDVMTTVDNIIKRFGQLSKTSDELKVSPEVKEGLEGLYKITVEQSNVMLSPEITKAAAKFIFSNLTGNAKNVLKLNAAVVGLDVDTYLINAITLASDATYKEDMSKTMHTLDTERGKGETERSFINTVVLGEGVEDREIMLAGTEGAGIKALGQVYGFRDEAGNKVGANNLEHILSQEKNALGNVIDANSISIGNTLVSSTDLYKLVYDGTSTLNRMILPINEDVYAATGKIKPDFDALSKFQRFRKWMKNNPNASPQEQALRINSLNLNIRYDADRNEWVFNNTCAFLTTNGYVSTEVINISDSEEKFLSRMTDSERSAIVDAYENYVNYGQVSEGKQEHANPIDLAGLVDWVDAKNMRKGMIFMPVLDRGMEYLAYNNEIVPKSDYVDMKNKRMIQDKLRNFKSNF